VIIEVLGPAIGLAVLAVVVVAWWWVWSGALVLDGTALGLRGLVGCGFDGRGCEDG
jgi:hypothetical protein